MNRLRERKINICCLTLLLLHASEKNEQDSFIFIKGISVFSQLPMKMYEHNEKMYIQIKLIGKSFDNGTKCYSVLKMHFEPDTNGSQLFKTIMTNF